jgi:hypothetical protein
MTCISNFEVVFDDRGSRLQVRLDILYNTDKIAATHADCVFHLWRAHDALDR